METQLLVRRGALGDTMLVEPIARAMRAERPELELHVAGVEENVMVLRWGGACVEAYSTELLPARLRGHRRVVADDPRLAELHPDVRIFDVRIGPEVHRRAATELLERAGYPRDSDAAPRLELPTVPRCGGALVHPGSGSPLKCIETRVWCEVVERVRAAGVDCAFIVGHVERERGISVERLRAVAPVIEPTSAVELAEVIARRDVFAGHDSGPTHLAAALGLHTIAVFVSTDSAVWAPPQAEVFGRGVSAAELALAITTSARCRATGGCRPSTPRRAP